MSKRRSFVDYKQFENIKVKNVTILKCLNPEVTVSKNRKFSALCDCGEKRIVRQYDIIHRQKLQCKKCGWKQLGEKKRKPDAGLNALILDYKKRCERDGLIFDLNNELFRKLTSSNCHYCNKKPSNRVFKDQDHRSQYIFNGIDRVDNKIGYTGNNCVPCCKNCNFAKGKLSYSEFRQFIRSVYVFWGKHE